MRYAIFSDVHANWQAWQAVREDAARQGVDALVCLGDVVGYGPRPLEVLRAVREATPNFVLGNHDAAACGRLDASIFNDRARAVIEWTRRRLDDEAHAFLQAVPLQMDGKDLRFTHAEVVQPGEFGYVDGIAAAELNLRALTQSVGFIGHTHLPLAFAMPRKGGLVTQLPPIDFELERGKRYLVNVGSVGEPRTTDVRASYVIFDDAAKAVNFRKVVFDVNAYIADLEETGLEIRPYFVQVVESGKMAGAPQPAPASQLALVQLPRVAEVVSGAHGQLVVGGPVLTAAGAPAATLVEQPRAISPWLIGLVGLMLVMVLGGLAMVALKKDEPAVAQGAGSRGGPSSRVEDQNRQDDSLALASGRRDPVGERAPREKPAEDPAPGSGSIEPTPPELPENDEPAPEEQPVAVERVAPEKLSQELLAYWSCDNPETRESRFEQWDDGTVVEKLVREKGQTVHYSVPDRDIGTRWISPDYDASNWQEGRNGVGYEDPPGVFRNLLASEVAGAPGRRPHSVYVRIPFQVDDPAAYDGLLLYMKYDDGFVAYLNGRQVTSSKDHAPPLGALRWNSAAVRPRNDEAALEAERFQVNSRRLVRGENVLAIHGLSYGGVPNESNTGSTSTAMLVLPTLVARRIASDLPPGAEPAEPSKHDRPVEAGQLVGVVTSVNGRYQEAYRLEDDGYLAIGAKDEFAIGEGSWTVSLWFSRDPDSIDSEARRLISAGAGGDGKAGWALWLSRKCDGLTFAVGNGAGRDTVTAKRPSLANGEWRHVAVTLDRESQSAAIFLDGELVADQRVGLLGEGAIGANSGLELGKNSDDAQHHRGELDDVGIWRRALLPAEVERIFKSGKALGELFREDGE